ncbi:MAG: hypothetical protein V4494_07615 [Chlamydiota bacterium]
MNTDQEIMEGAQEQNVVPEKRAPSAALVEFLEQFERESAPEDTIRCAINFMRTAISQTGTPRFKDFWEVRRLCLPFFKENLNPKVRVLLWGEYIELSGEARRIKEILDEQSSFAAEQIELAIAALEHDLEHFDQFLASTPALFIPKECTLLMEKKDFYIAVQKELDLLNTMASRINALRKEVVKTEMRVRYKNRFFDRLSAAGDRVFPRRKDLIKQISEEFSVDVTYFVEHEFNDNGQEMPPLFVLREEIKALQLMAKELTLNTQAFTETRLRLSTCWDKIRDCEKERKKEFAQKKQSYKQNYDLVFEKINAFAEICQNPELAQDECQRQTEEIQSFMHAQELGRDEVRMLRDELQKAKKPVLDRFREKEVERERLEKEEDLKNKEKLQDLRAQLVLLAQDVDQLDSQAFIEKRDQLLVEFERFSLNKVDKQGVDRLLKQVKDQINEKKEKAIMALSADDLEAFEQLKSALQERKQQRQEIREQLELYRKALGGSGLDFEKSMSYAELVETEKARLEKANAAIYEIEEKISEFQG